MSRSRILPVVAVAALVALALISRIGADEAKAVVDPPAGMVLPRYAEDGKLLVPEDYRTWVFVGASLGLNYAENAKENPESAGFFHHTYIQPEAYRHYRDTGTFPEKTMLILELYASEGKVAPDTVGLAQGKRVAVEVALKDHSRFEEGWAYFNFGQKEGKPQPVARNNPKKFCYDCHAAHAADDNVFTQYYPVLREAKEAFEAAKAK